MISLLRTAAIFAISIAFFSFSPAQVPLEKTPFWQSSETNMTTTGMVWRDCNRDGYIDVFFSNGNDITISPNMIYISDSGTLPEAASWFSSNNEYSGHCDVGDVDDDGWPDFAVANLLGANGFSSANYSNLYFNDNGQMLSDPGWYTGDSIYTFSCAFGDADGDGDLDLAFATGEGYNEIDITDRIYFNVDGQLQSSPGWQSAFGSQAMDVAWGDVDNDGDLDLAFCYVDSPPALYYNYGGNIEVTPSWEAVHDESANTIIFADINGDGWLDLVVAYNFQLGGTGYTRVYFNDGAGNLNTSAGWQSNYGGYGSALAVNDCDQDGDLDLAVGHWWQTPRVYLNLGTTLTADPAWTADISTVVEELAWVDVDGQSVQDRADTIFDIAGRKVFYTENEPLYEIDSVVVDGIKLGLSEYCFDLFSGWISLAQVPISQAIIYYKHSTNNDLAVANWDTFNMVFGSISVSLAMSHSNFSDNLGNGDGIFEAGETVEVTVNIQNSGSDTARNVYVDFYADDARLSIIDGTSLIGDIPAFSSADNTADPFQFEIPVDYIARIDSFFFEVSFNDTLFETFVVEKNIGRPVMLLVDDDNGDNLQSYYTGAFSRFRIPSDIREVNQTGSPAAADLADYELVIWYTGDSRPSPLALESVSAMKTHCDSGGSIFLTGQNIAAQTAVDDPDFLNNYLKAGYQSTSLIPVLEVAASSQIFPPDARISIYGGGGASNQSEPDLVSAINGGNGEMLYYNETEYGAISFAGDYRSLFFSFGFESIVSGDSRWRERDSIFSDIIDFFNLPRPGGYPQAIDIAVSPGDPFHMTDHTPLFSWIYFDPEASPQQYYQVQVGSDNDWTVAEMWDSGPVAGTETSVFYAGSELIDGEAYNYRLRVSDGALWSDWSQGGFRMNSVPGMVINLVPRDMSCVAEENPVLSHDNTEDPEGDNLFYDYELYANPDLTGLVTSADNVPEQTGSITSWTVPVSLSDNQHYYWRVRADDGFEPGPWSNTHTFGVNSFNQAPAAFALIAPDSAGLITESQPLFQWQAALDPDPCDSVVYRLSYADDAEMTDPVIISGLSDTVYIPEDTLPAGQYFWTVTALDLFDGQTDAFSTFSFILGGRGDANADGLVNVGDAVYIINYVFRNGPAPAPYVLGDANCDDLVNVGDAVYLVNYIFGDGPPPGCFKQ